MFENISKNIKQKKYNRPIKHIIVIQITVNECITRQIIIFYIEGVLQ